MQRHTEYVPVCMIHVGNMDGPRYENYRQQIFSNHLKHSLYTTGLQSPAISRNYKICSYMYQ